MCQRFVASFRSLPLHHVAVFLVLAASASVVFFPTFSNGLMTAWDDQWQVVNAYTSGGWCADNAESVPLHLSVPAVRLRGRLLSCCKPALPHPERIPDLFAGVPGAGCGFFVVTALLFVDSVFGSSVVLYPPGASRGLGMDKRFQDRVVYFFLSVQQLFLCRLSGR